MALDAVLSIASAGAARRVILSDYLDAEGEEQAAQQANRWIKSLRLARVDGRSFRERFTYRDDSLWWFAELYLHKEREVLSLFRILHAAAALFEREMPRSIVLERAAAGPRLVLPQIARRKGVQLQGPRPPRPSRAALFRMEARSTALMLGALASPDRPLRTRAQQPVRLVSFVHRAFWRDERTDGSAESYIGPVLQVLESRLPAGAIRHIGIGPADNFRARRWWRRGSRGADAVQPIERLVPRTALAGSSGLWAARHTMRRALAASRDLREAAVIDGCDCWPVIEQALAGIALLQFPWSARAMDEAGAAMDALQPAAMLTYAEAGGWGRALAIEARRRGIPFAGLQHGFIYRHWLNYLHEPDEMQPLAPGSTDRGFPRPDVTLLFDLYAARHLVTAGRFAPESLAVTGSPRLDSLAATFRKLDAAAIEGARRACGAGPSTALVLLVTKYSEVRTMLPALLEAVQTLPGTQLAIKTHPAETPEAYQAAVAGHPRAMVLPASAPLAPLLAACRAVVTVNSTVALDAMALGVPALSIGLPNNLSPFIDAGAIAGAGGSAAIAPELQRLLYDEVFRQQLSALSASLAAEYQMVPTGSAAGRQADVILGLIPPGH
jgi:hypothetical protein